MSYDDYLYAQEFVAPGVTANTQLEAQWPAYQEKAIEVLNSQPFWQSILGIDPRVDELAAQSLQNGGGATWFKQQLEGSTWGLHFLTEHGGLLNGATGGGSGLTTAQKEARILASLQDLSAQLGLNVGDDRLTAIAKEAVANNFNDAQLNDALFSSIDPLSVTDGTIKNSAFELQNYAREMGLNLTAENAISYGIKIASNEMTLEGAQQAVRTEVLSNRPELQRLIEGGGSVNTYETNVSGIAARAAQLGISLTNEQINTLAENATLNEWSELQVNKNIVSAAGQTQIGEGDITAARDQVKILASQYLLPMTDATAMDLAKRQVIGEITENGVLSMLMNQAKADNPWLSSIIDSGLTPTDYFSPKREYLAQMLEMSADDIDLMDAGYMDILTRTENGSTRGATLTEIAQSARSDSRWQSTDAARSALSTVTSAVADLFGLRGF